MTDPTEIALWAAIGERPEDWLRRKVLADWYEENAGTVECGCDDGSIDTGGTTPWDEPISVMCGVCDGTGRVSDGRAEMAEALRATVDRVPLQMPPVDGHGPWVWMLRVTSRDAKHKIIIDLHVHLTGVVPREWPSYRDYHTAADAIRDLCRAWIAARKGVTT